MEIAIIYNTGTYNTLYLTTLLKNRLIEQKHKVSVFNIDAINKIDFNKYEYIGILSNIRYRNIPDHVINNLKNTNIKNKKYFVITCGAFNYKLDKYAFYNLYKCLSKNNNELISYYNLLMPSNYKKRTKDEDVPSLILNNKKEIIDISNNFFIKKPFKINIINTMLLKIYEKHAKKLIKCTKKFQYDNNLCIKCKKCSTNCPTNNIEYIWQEKTLVFKDKCRLCGRCYFNCPVNAINIGKLEPKKVNGKYNFYKK